MSTATKQPTDTPEPTGAGAAERNIEELDVRPLLQRGEEPFAHIMAAVARVGEHGALRLRATFEPQPLYAVLGRQGFSHSTRQLGADDWEVLFTRDAAPSANA